MSRLFTEQGQPIADTILETADIEVMFDELMGTLREGGLPIVRTNCVLTTLHPQIVSQVFRWERTNLGPADRISAYFHSYNERPLTHGTVRQHTMKHGIRETSAFINSPLYRIIIENAEYRNKMADDQSAFEYPILEEFHAAGIREYFGIPLVFQSGVINAMVWCTDAEDGFTEEQVALLRDVSRLLKLRIEAYREQHVGRHLLQTYLGAHTGTQVYQGRIQRGDVEDIRAAIWFSDLRDFSELANRIAKEELLEVLNAYFEVTTNTIAAHEGEVLKFIGDAVLAVFPVQDASTGDRACHNALRAALAARERLSALNARRTANDEAPIRHGVALHLGAASYGNVGSADRLDFTVIGEDVNFASRIEGLCAPLGEDILLSQAFSERTENSALKGTFELKGFNEAQSVFAPRG